MSLLLDALKRAEQEKQARQGERQKPTTGKPSLELAPLVSQQPDAAPRATAVPLAAMPKSAPATGSRKGLWIAAGAIVLAIVIGAGYIWYSIASLSPGPALARAPAPRPIAPATLAVEPVSAKKVEAPAELAPAPKPPSAPQIDKRPAPSSARTQPAAPAMLQASRPADRARIAPEVATGYAALRAGDLATAKRDYSAALAADASNLDATLGLATVEARNGRPEAAASLYRHALDIDPRNATALAGLAALSGGARGESLEQQLQRDLAQHPESSALYFMLGNVHASQSLWTQAQSAYFEAHRLDPRNPDILHNLAVSLDRLGQAKVAATFYRRALEAAKLQASQFDANAVAKRLAEIEASN